MPADMLVELCSSNVIPEGTSRGFSLGADSLFVVRKGGSLFAYRNSCPHLGVSLNWHPDDFLDAEGELIQCSTHGALFLIDSGECVSGPCLGKLLVKQKVIERNGSIFLHRTQPDH